MKILLSENINLFHKLNSKTCINDQILLIIHYDYFFNKRDLRILLHIYKTIYLVPIHEYNSFYNNDFIFDTFNTTSNLTLVYNPSCDSTIEKTIEFSLGSNKHLHVYNVYDFCEKFLKKCYISNCIDNTTPKLNDLKYFEPRIRIFKKLIDLGIGIPLYILTQPIWLISAFKIYQESPGTIFYKQQRIGIRNTPFEIFKFRTMRVDAEVSGAQFSSKNDKRIFTWGKIMRATRIDELPQLFNILKGELSLIGPRPERKIFIETFEELIPHYNERHAVKPGISGYAQIMYAYGAGVKDARHKLMYDLYYVKNWNVFLEIKIIILTFWIMTSKKGM